MHPRRSFGLCVCILLAGCSLPVTRRNQGASQPPQAPHTTPSVTSIADNDEAIWPDPARRTVARLGVLQNLLEDWFALNRRFPASLDAVIPSAGVPGMDVRRDGWGRPWAYTPNSSDYTLASAGLDGRMRTRDDIAITRHSDLRGYER